LTRVASRDCPTAEVEGETLCAVDVRCGDDEAPRLGCGREEMAPGRMVTGTSLSNLGNAPRRTHAPRRSFWGDTCTLGDGEGRERGRRQRAGQRTAPVSHGCRSMCLGKGMDLQAHPRWSLVGLVWLVRWPPKGMNLTGLATAIRTGVVRPADAVNYG